jgi:ferredoxin
MERRRTGDRHGSRKKKKSDSGNQEKARDREFIMKEDLSQCNVKGMTMTIEQPSGSVALRIEDLIRTFAASPENTLKDKENHPAWDSPLIGFSRGDDPLYEKLKDHIGPFLWTPFEIFSITYPDIPVNTDSLSVISWILPQTEVTKAMNRKETHCPSEPWARSRKFGEEFNMKMARHVVAELKNRGIPALAPGQSVHWDWQTSRRYGRASNWSERHVAYVSGLGTFSLSDGLITERGKAMRCGSVVAKLRIPATPRPYDSHRSYCLFYKEGSCGKCIDRCPVKAISKDGHDKERCYRYVFGAATRHITSAFGFETHACGLCQTNVPCESNVPFGDDVHR